MDGALKKNNVSLRLEHLWQDFVRDVGCNRILFPSMPEIALRVRKLLSSPDVTSNRLAQIINSDPVLGSRLIRAANGPMSRGRKNIYDLKGAVTRLGFAGVRSIVMSYAVEQVYANNLTQHPMRKRLLHEIWSHSTHVAALSHVIARDHTRLEPEKAMFSGLIHDIGKLPLVEYLECVPELFDQPKNLQKVLSVLHGRAGEMILRRWQFAEETIQVVKEHDDYMRQPAWQADYVDVVLVANLLSHIGTDHPCTQVDWTRVPAFSNLGLTPEASIEAMKAAHDEIQEIKQLFS
ncbi:MAG: HDOD domain-containing protein [Gammaproteobacteria bacterium]|nr:HDOD domain-containing protein [Gammaproteobacteria bacterium]